MTSIKSAALYNWYFKNSRRIRRGVHTVIGSHLSSSVTIVKEFRFVTTCLQIPPYKHSSSNPAGDNSCSTWLYKTEMIAYSMSIVPFAFRTIWYLLSLSQSWIASWAVLPGQEFLEVIQKVTGLKELRKQTAHFAQKRCCPYASPPLCILQRGTFYQPTTLCEESGKHLTTFQVEEPRREESLYDVVCLVAAHPLHGFEFSLTAWHLSKCFLL